MATGGLGLGRESKEFVCYRRNVFGVHAVGSERKLVKVLLYKNE